MIWVVASAWAEEPLTVEAAQQEARAHAPEVGELAARVQGADRIASSAGRYWQSDPTASVQTPLDGSGWSVGLAVPLDVSGAWLARGESARADLAVARFQKVDGLRALDEAVAVAVAVLADTQRGVARGERAVALLRVAADAAHAKADVGEGPGLDADAADLDLAVARARLARARGDVEAARAALARLLGRASADGIVVADPDDRGTPAPVDVEAAIEAHPSVQAADAGVDAARAQLAAAKRAGWLAPSLRVQFGRQTRDVPAGAFAAEPSLAAAWTEPELVVSLATPLPLFDRGADDRAAGSARLWLAQSRAATVRADLRAELERRRAGLDAAGAALEVLLPTDAILARDEEKMDRALREGELDATTRAVAVGRLVEARRELDSAVLAYRVARARWERFGSPRR